MRDENAVAAPMHEPPRLADGALTSSPLTEALDVRDLAQERARPPRPAGVADGVLERLGAPRHRELTEARLRDVADLGTRGEQGAEGEKRLYRPLSVAWAGGLKPAGQRSDP